MAMRCVLVHVNENSSPDITRFIIEHSESRVVFVSKRVGNGRALSLIKEILPSSQVRCIEEDLSLIEESGIEGTWPEIPPRMEDLAILMYTSGTTAKPKGVMLTHGNLVAGAYSLASNIPESLLKSISQWKYYNFLPLSHIYGLEICFCFMRLGGVIGFFGGNRAEILNEIRIFKPHLIACVPRVLQKFYEGILSKLTSSSIALRGTFWVAYAHKKWAISNGYKSPVADKIFQKVRDRFGGELQIVLNGGAPIQKTHCRVFSKLLW